MSHVFNWDESFLTGLPLVDGQHKRLVDIVNDMGELSMSGGTVDPQELAAVTKEMLDYAETHFRDEEELMEKSGLDSRHISFHHAQHGSFFEEARSLTAMGKEAFPEQAKTRELLQYLVDWLAYHILGIDQSMTRQIRSVENGRSGAQAFEAEKNNTQDSTEPLLTALKGLFQKVSERNRELRKLNRTLENRVKERTRELEQANRQLQTLAIQDELTGLPNRRYALSAINRLWEESRRDEKPLSVLMLDADKFKQVNDRFGHDEGDALLQMLAGQLSKAVRTDDIVCRLGGDEFLIICPQCAKKDATLVAKKILDAPKSYCNADGVECWNGAVSIGVAQAEYSMTQPEQLIKAADQELYAAKQKGGSRTSSS
jgi:hemerythrin